MDNPFNGLGMTLGNLARLSSAISRSISAENPTGAKGQGGRATEGTGAVPGRELGQGWKISPYSTVPAGGVVTLAHLDRPGPLLHLSLAATPSARRPLALPMGSDREHT